MNPVQPKQKVTALGANYSAQLDQLAADAAAIEQAYKLCAQRPWMMPDPAPGGWLRDLLDTTSIGAAFVRTENNADYVEAVSATPRGVLSDTIVSKAQVDYLASMERSFRLRHLSQVRAAFHAAGRRRGHGHTNGLFVKILPEYLERVIQAGSNPAAEQPDV